MALTTALCAVTGLAVWWVMNSQRPMASEAPAIRAELSLPGLTLPSLVGKDDTNLALSLGTAGISRR